MTYEQLIPRLGHELRDQEAWPSDSTKILEQINLLYNAALAVGRTLPLARLTIVESAALAGTVAKGVVSRYDLNQAGLDIFDLRWAPDINVTDMGIAAVRLDGEDFELPQGVSVNAILSVGNGGIQKSRKLFALDFPNDQIYASNVADLKLWHVAKFTRPTYDAVTPDPVTDYTNLDFPLQDDNDTQRVVHIVAAHVSGVTIKDPAGAQFQSLLEQTYAG